LLSPVAAADDWTFGGGTALMLHYEHRISRDIDIFLRDPQLLTRLTPRLNDRAASLSRDYVEASNFLKLTCHGGEIDFIVAPSLTDAAFVERDVDGLRLRLETPVEIGMKKAFYRTADLLPRDVLDIALIVTRDGEAVRRNASVLLAKRALLVARIQMMERTFASAAREIDVLPAGAPYLLTAPQVVLRFLTALS
jgi:hypothetical protein